MPFAENLAAVRARIADACAAARRPAASVQLIAVSKTVAAPVLRAAAAAGQSTFGESYVQEALPKLEALADLPLQWHFIGPVQSNKTAAIAQRFDWVHGVDRLKIAERLSTQRPPHRPALNVCLQVNISGQSTKSGCSLEELPALAAAVAGLPHLRLRGLMAIPEPDAPAEAYRAMQAALAELQSRHAGLDTLSMGMSDDLECAIAHGATMVRVGSALFGARAPAA